MDKANKSTKLLALFHQVESVIMFILFFNALLKLFIKCMDLENKQLTGPLPSSYLGSLPRLQESVLHQNPDSKNLSGSVYSLYLTVSSFQDLKSGFVKQVNRSSSSFESYESLELCLSTNALLQKSPIMQWVMHNARKSSKETLEAKIKFLSSWSLKENRLEDSVNCPSNTK